MDETNSNVIQVELNDLLKATRVINLLLSDKALNANLKNIIIRNKNGVLEVVGSTQHMSCACSVACVGTLPNFKDTQFAIKNFLTILSTLSASTKTTIGALKLTIGDKFVNLKADEYLITDDGPVLLDAQALDWNFPVTPIRSDVAGFMDLGNIPDDNFKVVNLVDAKFVIDQALPRLTDGGSTATSFLTLYKDYTVVAQATYKLFIRDIFGIIEGDAKPLQIPKRGLQFLKGVFGLVPVETETVTMFAENNILNVRVDDIKILIRGGAIKAITIDKSKEYTTEKGFAVNRLHLQEVLKRFVLNDENTISLTVGEDMLVITQNKATLKQTLPVTVKPDSELIIDGNIELFRQLIIAPEVDDVVYCYYEFLGDSKSQIALTITDASATWFGKVVFRCKQLVTVQEGVPVEVPMSPVGVV